MVKIKAHSNSKQVSFSEIKEGGWFLFGDQLGVKVDGFGFYPSWFEHGPLRGVGGENRKVTPVHDVEITHL